MSTESPKKTSTRSARVLPHAPPAYEGLQVNFCRYATCTSCGIPPLEDALRVKGPRLKGVSDPVYSAERMGNNTPGLRCRSCGKTLTLKSNQGVYEEWQRIRRPMQPKKATLSCPTEGCVNTAVSASDSRAYARFGKTSSGSPRYKCKACGKVFSAQPSIGSRQRKTSNNGDIFKALVNGVLMRRICRIVGVAPKTLYERLRFIATKCEEFAADRERKLIAGDVAPDYLSVSVDMQVYVSNWPRKEDKRRIDLYGMGSADNSSGYVFAMTLNYDQTVDAEEAETALSEREELGTPACFRDYARIWLPGEFESTNHTKAKQMANARDAFSGESEIAVRYDENQSRPVLENAEVLSPTEFQLPPYGSRTKTDYMSFGHFMYLAELFRHVPRVVFYLDQDSVFYAGVYGAFLPRFKTGTADAYYVTVKKGASSTERQAAFRKARRALKEEMAADGEDERSAALRLVRREMGRMESIGPYEDRWLVHPQPNQADVDKRVCHMTPFEGRSQSRLESQYLYATLHGIDRFFNNVRRSLRPMERSIISASSDRRTWNAYSNYNPQYAELLLKIFRTYYNYCHVPDESKDGLTPAQRIGLAKGCIDPHDVLYFDINTKS